jgi:uroporphyrinogen-III synthase
LAKAFENPLSGGGTEKILLQSALKNCETIKPKHQSEWDSEGLWQAMLTYQKDWANQSIMIIKGDTGRDWLENTLQNANANVQTLSIYKRQNLSLGDPYWQIFLNSWSHHSKHLHPENPSNEALNNESLIWVMSSSLACTYLESSLIKLQLKEQILSQSIALATHENIAHTAQNVGFSKVKTILPGQESIETNIKNWITKQI